MKTHIIKAGFQGILLASVIAVSASASTPFILNVDFNGNDFPSGKVGLAATGATETDYWNWYTRNDGSGGWRTFGTLNNLQLVDGTVTSVDLTILNCPGAWGSGSPDPMYHSYIYPFSGDGIFTFSDLPAGLYDVYAYSTDGNFEVTVGSLSYGVEHTRDYPLMTPLVWTEGVQYARFENIVVGSGQELKLTVRDGVDRYAIISGLQVVAVPEPTSMGLLGCGIAVAAWWRSRRPARES